LPRITSANGEESGNSESTVPMSDVLARLAHGWQRIALKLSADEVLKYSAAPSVKLAPH
jgi:hypothetical protein